MRCFGSLVLLFIATQPALAQGITCWGIQGYVSDPKLVFTFESDDPAGVTVIGPTETVGVTFEGLEFDPNGNLYAYGRSSNPTQTGLYLIDQSSGEATYLGGGSTGGEWVRGLAYDPSTDQLLAVTRNGVSTSVYAIDELTGAPTLLETTPDLGRGDGIAIDAFGERILLDAYETRVFRGCDPSEYAPLGPTGLNLYFESGIVVDWSRDSALYLVSWQEQPGSSLYLVNPDDGSTSSLGAIGTSTGQQYYPTDVAFPLAPGVGPAIPEPDCNGNGIPDHCEIASGAVTDLDSNGVPDSCDIAAGAPDCNTDGVLDVANRVETQSYVVGSALSMTVGDVDANGSLDLVLCSWANNDIRFLINDGTGHFTAGLTLDHPGPRRVFVQDFDADGANDLLVSGTNDVSLRLNDGFGDFSSPEPVAAHSGSLHLADLNEDGLTDLVVVDGQANVAHIDLATAPGTFVTSTIALVDSFLRVSAVADFDGDDHQDLLVIHSGAGPYLYPGDGAGGFLAGVDLQAPLAYKAAVLDVNADGILDLVERRDAFSDEFRVYLGDGSGDFVQSWTEPAMSHPWAVAAWESNGAGQPSLVFTEEDSRFVTVHRWTGGQLTPYQVFPLHRNVGRINFVLDDPDAITVADFDEDGQEDLAVLIIAVGSVSVLLQQDPDCDRNGTIDPCDFAAGGDSDGDGVLDACEAVNFLRGDVNSDALVDIGDPIDLLGRLFAGVGPAPCLAATNTNSDAAIDIADVIFLLSFLFTSGAPPLPPFPACGPSLDPVDTGLGCGLEGC